MAPRKNRRKTVGKDVCKFHDHSDEYSSSAELERDGCDDDDYDEKDILTPTKGNKQTNSNKNHRDMNQSGNRDSIVRVNGSGGKKG